uniref:RING-type domain-containing protein n=1 Tax=Noctiluca scintillans TaxID=2966 RepID=A0A7S1EZ39_NOCSC
MATPVREEIDSVEELGERVRTHVSDVVAMDVEPGGEAHSENPRATFDPRPELIVNIDEMPMNSPMSGVWLAEPASIDEPLLLLDEVPESQEEEPEDEPEELFADVVTRLRRDLEEARLTGKADRARAEALGESADALERERDAVLVRCQQLERENCVLRLELQHHRGIMAADWEQTLGFQERLRSEEAEHARLSEQVIELQRLLNDKIAECFSCRDDALSWRTLLSPKAGYTSGDLDRILQVALPAAAQLQAELSSRAKVAQRQLISELEHRLCAVCRDEEKAVLFLPCNHVCVCETCRSRLRPYRCPMCQEPIQQHIGRVHF